jgi:hypothetical protein
VCDVMVIGAAVGQLPLIRKVQAMGHRALVVSCPGPYPGLDEADEALLVDIRDWDEIGRMGRDRNVAAVVTDQTDVCLPTAAAVAEELGLPGVPSALVSLFTNKQKLRALCRAREILTPCSYTVRSLSDLAEASKALACPFVLKPVDSDGSRGVQIVRDLSGLGQAYEKSLVFSRSGVLLAESYIAGVRSGGRGARPQWARGEPGRRNQRKTSASMVCSFPVPGSFRPSFRRRSGIGSIWSIRDYTRGMVGSFRLFTPSTLSRQRTINLISSTHTCAVEEHTSLRTLSLSSLRLICTTCISAGPVGRGSNCPSGLPSADMRVICVSCFLKGVSWIRWILEWSPACPA